VLKALEEIVDVHDRYKDFGLLTRKQAKEFIRMKWEEGGWEIKSPKPKTVIARNGVISAMTKQSVCREPLFHR
jgi:hypothetical protein